MIGQLFRRTRGRTASAPVTCPRCGATFVAALTGWCCPLCSAPVETGNGRRAGRGPDSDDRLLALVVAATLANVLLLAGLAIAVLHATH